MAGSITRFHTASIIQKFQKETGLKVITDVNLDCRVMMLGFDNIFIGSVDGYIPEKNAIIVCEHCSSPETSYLKKNSKGEFELLGNIPGVYYYEQIQIYLEATSKQLCYFAVNISSEELRIAEVQRDQHFFANEIKPVLQAYL